MGTSPQKEHPMVFTKLTSAVTRHPWVVIAIWVVAAFVLSTAGMYKATDVLTDDQAEFLPSSYESARGLKFGREAFGEVKGATSVTVIVKPREGHLGAPTVTAL